MINVLVVGDNAIKRKSIILAVDWTFLGFKVIAEADNGISALTIAEKYKPEIIIIDIESASMSDFDFVKKVSLLFPYIKIIIATDEKNLPSSKKALSLGAFSFCVLPIEKEDFEENLKDAACALSFSQNKISVQSKTGGTNDSYDNFLSSETVIDILEGRKNPQLLNLSTSRCFFLTKRFSTLTNRSKNYDQLNESLHLVEILKNRYNYAMESFHLNGFFTILVFEKGENFPKLSDNIAANIASNFSAQSTSRFDTSAFIGVGNIHSEASELHLAFQESVSALETGFYYSVRRVILPNMIRPQGVINESELLLLIENSLKSSDQNSIFNSVSEIRKTINAKTPSVKTVKHLTLNILYCVIDYCLRKKPELQNTFKSRSDIASDIGSIDNINSLFTYINNFIRKVQKKLNSNVAFGNSDTTLKIIEYINEHYKENLTLEKISEVFSVSASNLEKTLKNDTDKTFEELLNSLRIEKAKRFLSENRLSPMSVAQLVGIENYSEFYRLFKNATELSPNDYFNSRHLAKL